MKAAFFLVIIVIMAGCVITPSATGSPEKVDEFAKARTSGNFSGQGAIAFTDDDYHFTIILVNDLEWAM